MDIRLYSSADLSRRYVYILLDEEYRILYVGRTKGLGQRLYGHSRTPGSSFHHVITIPVGSPDGFCVRGDTKRDAAILEHLLIMYYQPPRNKYAKELSEWSWERKW